MRSIPLRLGQEPVDATIYATTATIFYCTIVRGSGVSYILGFLEVARVAQLAVHLTSMSFNPELQAIRRFWVRAPARVLLFYNDLCRL